MRTAVCTLYINDFSPEIFWNGCYPLQKRWADKIRADYHIIESPSDPPKRWPTLEKFQCHDLFSEYDYVYFIDADALVRPDCWDFQQDFPPHTVLFWGYDHSNRWFRDDYFLRDGRMISACTWFVGCPKSCHELWTIPQDITLDEMVSRISPDLHELTSDVHTQPISLIDDYILSRQIATYGFKVGKLTDLFKKIGRITIEYFWHEYTISKEKKLEKLKDKLEKWGIRINNPRPSQTPATP